MTQETFNNLTLQERRFALLLDDVFSESEQIRIGKALEHARRAHDGQRRDDGVPYIIHPIRTAIFLIEHEETDADLIIATLLHDVIEDCNVTIQDILTMYNERVAHLVKDATRERPEHETEAMKRDAKPRKFRWYIAEACQDSCKIKSADVIDNMLSWQFIPQGHATREKFPRWCSEAETFYPELTKKAGQKYYETCRNLVRAYQQMPQFRDYLTGDYRT
jgi:GTP pyrophosphokinase